MTLKACGTYVIVELIEKEQTTPGGIVLPESVEGMNCGRVVSVGPGRNKSEPVCKEGDVVIFSRDYYDNSRVIREGDKKMVFLQFGDIIAIDTGA